MEHLQRTAWHAVWLAAAFLFLGALPPLGGAEIEIRGKGTAITNGDVTPDAADDTDFGTVLPGVSVLHTFTVANPGGDTLNLTGNPRVTVTGEQDGFETGGLAFWSWITGGQGTWAVQSTTVKDGGKAAKAPAVGDNQSAHLQVTADCRAGEVGFWYKVSSEAGWDFLRFLVDGAVIDQWSGEQGWTYYSYTVAAGSHTFRWEYVKDSYGVGGADSAWLDSVALPVASRDFTVTVQPAASVAPGGTSTFNLVFLPPAAAWGLRTTTVSVASNDEDRTPYRFAVSGTVSGPDIRVSGNGVPIARGDGSPSVSDDTDFGEVGVTTGTAERTYTIGNEGSLDLTVSSITVGADFRVTATSLPLPATVAPGSSMTFVATFDPSAVGVRQQTLTIQSNDPNKILYGFVVGGTGVLIPEVGVSGNGIAITHGDMSPDGSDNTDFGMVALGTSATRIFTIANTGIDPLELTGDPPVLMTGEMDGFETGDFSFWWWARGGTAGAGDWTVQSDTVKHGTKAVKAGAVGANQLTALGVSTRCLEGHVGFWYKVSSFTGWDFLRFKVDGVTVAEWSGNRDWAYYSHPVAAGYHRFQWEYAKGDMDMGANQDTAWLDSIMLPIESKEFEVTTQPAASVSTGGSTTFEVGFRPSSGTAGPRSAIVTIPNSDAVRTPYRFMVTATGTLPEMEVTGNGTAIADGDTTPDAADDTHFGFALVAGGTTAHTFTITNTGTADLELATIGATGDFAVTSTSQALPAPVAPGDAMTFTVTFDPSASALRTGTVTISGEKASLHSFSLSGNGRREIEVTGNERIIYDTDTTPTPEDGTDFGLGMVGRGLTTHTFTVTNLLNSDLDVTAIAVTGDFTVTGTSQTLPATLAAGASMDLAVLFDPTAVALRRGTLSISYDQDGGSAYSFSLQGTGTQELLVTSNADGPDPAQGTLRWALAQPADGTRYVRMMTGTTTLQLIDSLEITSPTVIHLMDVTWLNDDSICRFSVPVDSRVTIRGDGTFSLFRIGVGGSLRIEDLTLADGGGSEGGAFRNEGTLEIVRSLLRDNTATWGGAIWNTGSLLVSNTTLSANRASWGGAVHNLRGTAKLQYVTASQNQASTGGGVLACAGGSARIHRSVLWGNPSPTHSASPSNPQITEEDGATVSVTQSIIEGGHPGYYDPEGIATGDSYDPLILTDNLDVDPLLTPLVYPPYVDSPPMVMAHDLRFGSPAFWVCSGLAGEDRFGEDYDKLSQNLLPRDNALAGVGAVYYNTAWPPVRFGTYWQDAEGAGTNTSPQAVAVYEDFLPITVNVYSHPSWQTQGRSWAGGKVYFTAPDDPSRPTCSISPNPATIAADNTVTIQCTANAYAGSYVVQGHYTYPHGHDFDEAAPDLKFQLTNNKAPSLVVTTDADDSVEGSLRWALANTAPGGVVTFDNDYTFNLNKPLEVCCSIDGGDHSIVFRGKDRVGVMRIQDSATLRNLTVADGGFGGVVIESGSDFTFENVIFRNNGYSTGSMVGALCFYGFYDPNPIHLRLFNCQFLGNTSNWFGGGAILAMESDGVMEVVNCAFVGNSASEGGAVRNVYVGLISGMRQTFSNCIFSANTADQAPVIRTQFFRGDNSVTFSHCCVQNAFDSGAWDSSLGTDGGGNVDADPLFESAAGADGIYGTDDDDLRLQPDSPLLDAGDNSLVPEELTQDFAGNLRITDYLYNTDTGSGTAPIVDIGPYEFATPAPTLASGAYVLADIEENDFDNVGTLVADIVADVGGVAIVAADSTDGEWQFSIDGTTWSAIGSVSAATARLLAADDTTRLRFVPGLYYNGTVAVTFHAWNRTSGANGGMGSASATGGMTAYSVDSDQATVTITPVDQAPVVGSIPNQTVDEGNPTGALAFSLQDIDDATETLVLSGVSSNPELLPAANIVFGGSGGNRTVTLTPVQYQSGQAQVTVTASDGELSGSRSFLLTVKPVNNAPTISAIPDQAVQENGTTGAIAFTVDDIDTAVDALLVSGTSANPSLVPNTVGAIVCGGSGANRTVTVTPTPGRFGTAVINVTVSDGQLYHSTSFNLTVTPVNTAPVINTVLPDRTIDQDKSMSPTSFSVSDRETSAGLLQLSAASDNPALVPVPNIVFGTSGVARTVSLTPVPGGYGTATITVTVSDGELNSARSFTLTVNHTNQAPAISMIPDQAVLQNSSTVAIPFTITDRETAPASLSLFKACSDWALIPFSGIALGGSGGNRSVTITPAAGKTGSAIITISVSDGDLMTPTHFTVTVNATNQAPTIQFIANQSTRENTATGSIALTVGDVDDAVDTLTLSGTSNNLALVPASGFAFGGTGSNRTVTITPAANQFGSALVTITVSDGELGASRSFSLTVTAVNTAPTIEPIADQSMQQDGAPHVVPFTVGDREQGAGGVSIFVRTGNSDLVSETDIAVGGSGASRTLTITPKANRAGSSAITVWVYDGIVSTPGSFTFTVAPVNKAPTISAIADQTAAEDTGTPANWFWVGDRETPGAELTLTASSSNTVLIPDGSIVLGGAPYYRNVTAQPAADKHGTAVVTVTVSDGEFSASTHYTVTVTPVNDAPTVTAVADQVIDQNGATGAVGFTVADVETEPTDLVVTASSSNQALLPDASILLGGAGAERTVSLAPLAQQHGATTVTLTVSDGELESSRSFNLLVNQVNQPPRISLLADLTMAQDTVSPPIAFSVGDPESAPADLVVTAVADNPTLVSPAGLALGGTGAERTLTVTPARYRNGTATITLTVSDGDRTAESSFTLTVTATDYAPVLVSFTHPVTSIGLDVPITQYEAWDDAGVTGYLVTTTDTPPSYDDPGWSATPPATFTVSDIGVYTLYPWVKDATGNVSDLYPITYEVNVVNNVVHVAPGGAGDGSSWASPCDLQYATQFFALPGYELWVKAGTYTPRDGDGNPTRHATFSLAYGVSLYGGFAGTETARGQRDPAANPTIVSGDMNGDDGPGFAGNSENAQHVFTLSGGTLDGVTVCGGNADGVDYYEGKGGGILVTSNGDPLLNDVVVAGNSATEGGGIHIVDGATPTLTNVTIADNRATGSGGGMYLGTGAAPIVRGATVSGNTAAQGGGMMVANNLANATLVNVTFTGNTASDADGQGGGAAMVDPSGQVRLVNCTISGNSTDSDEWFAAGGITSLFGTVNLGNTIVAGNTSASGKPDLAGFFQSLGHNLIGSGNGIEGGIPADGVDGDQVGAAATPIDAGLGPLADNGGPTRTMALLAGSPAVGAGDDALCPDTDQRGVSRPQGSQSDIGACERSYGQVTLTSSANPVPCGQSVTFTAAVAPPEATGTVTFKEGETILAAGIPLSGGTAVFATATLALGSHLIVAEYSGDAATVAATSPAMAQTVIRGNQSIGPVTFVPAAPIPVGGTTTVAAVATSGLQVQFSSLTPEICSVVGTTVTALAPGTGLIAADQTGSESFNPALRVIASLAVGRMPATVALAGLSQVYDGTPRVATATTDPADRSVLFSYTGSDGTTYGPSATPPTDAGTYAVVATIDDSTYAGSASGTLVVAKGNAAVFLDNVAQTYDGTAKPIAATTAPEGLPISLAYAGDPAAPVNVGSYPVVATVTDANYAGTASVTLTIRKGTATIALDGLTRIYDGTAKSVTASTRPSGLAVVLSYDGRAEAPVDAGSYSVVATVVDPNYGATASGTLAIGKADQTISFEPPPPVAVAASEALAATSTSGKPVVFRSLNRDVATVVGSTVLGKAVGECTILAEQPGDDNLNPALPVTRILTVSRTTFTLTYHADAHATITGPTPQTVGEGLDGAAVTAVPDAGYRFVRWSDGITTATRTDTDVAANVEVTAETAINSYTLTFESAGGTAVAAITQDYGTTVAEPTEPTRVGYTFAGWSPAVPATMPAGDLTLTAQWSPNTYAVTFHLGDHGTWTGGGALSQTVNHGEAAAAPEFAVDAGWIFTGWDTAFASVTSGLSVTATYAQLYALAVTNGSGDGSYAEGTVVAVAADVAPAGQKFVGWTVDPPIHAGSLADAAASSTTFTMPPAAVVLAASYAADPTDPFGDPAVYPAPPMSVLVRVSRTQGGVEEGDVVGAFADGELRGKSPVYFLGGVTYANLTVSVKGDGEAIAFRLHDASAGTTDNGNRTVTAAVGGSLGTPADPVDVVFGLAEQDIELAAGWNQVSLNVRPSDPACDSVFAGIMGMLEKAIVVRRIIGGGGSYTPGWGELNTLTQLEDGRAYWVRVSGPLTWTVEGTPLDAASTPITLWAGWNYIAFIGPSASTVEGALAGIMEVLQKVVGDGGNYTPGWGGLNTLTMMRPGVGYWVKVSASTTLTYGFEDPGGRAIRTGERTAPDWAVVQPDPPAMAHTIMSSATLDGNPLATGSRLGVFVDGVCRAVGERLAHNDDSYFNLTVLMGTAGDAAEFRLYDAASGTVYGTDFTMVLSPGAADGTPTEPVAIAFSSPVVRHAVTFRPGLHGALAGGSPDVVVVVEQGEPVPSAPGVVPADGWIHVGWEWTAAERGAAPTTIEGDWTATALYDDDVLAPPAWQLELALEGALPATLNLGMRADATNGWDAGVDVAYPLPGPGQACLASEDLALSYSSDYRALAETGEFLLLVSAGDAVPATVSWSASDLPEGKFLSIYEVVLDGIVPERATARSPVGNTARNMALTTSLAVPPGKTRSFVVRYGDDLVFDLAFEKGWNLVSLPVEPLDPRVETVLADSVLRDEAGSALRDGLRGTVSSRSVSTWQGQSYAIVAEMHAGIGYWVHATEATTVLVAGTPIGQTAWSLLRGWNQRGVEVPCPVPADGRLIGPLWEWDARLLRYRPVEGSLLPGHGYWINTEEDGPISLSTR